MLLLTTTCYTCNPRGAARRPRALSDFSPPSFSLSLAGVALVSFPLVMRFQLLPLSKTAFALRFPPGAHVCRFPICVTTHQFLAGCVPPASKPDSLSDRSPFRCFYVQTVKLLWLGNFKSIVAGQI